MPESGGLVCSLAEFSFDDVRLHRNCILNEELKRPNLKLLLSIKHF